MSYSHAFPEGWDIDWIIQKAQLFIQFSIAASDPANPGFGKLIYNGTPEQFETVTDLLEQYPSLYAEEVLKPRLWEQVKELRTQHVFAGADTPSGAVDTSEEAQRNIVGATLAAQIALAAAQPFSIDWTMADNSEANLDAEAMIAVGLAVVAHIDACHARARALRAEINAAANVDAVSAIDITTGWPE
ncbi:DUF4376 domain-containing protein [Novosphingobium sp. YJ-S2-02]|uniref:DUF4376 domain-containing protein n=1 Tax=Novosphingobium aureum TaxID=2792964 RepID=A0A931MKA5_9SPHN|nr:DUF4376 domain-containing protein [Novosphingobium aureum]MBH0112702.1 DUF4376 domain-containing protein [Novosphingobium aureum]